MKVTGEKRVKKPRKVPRVKPAPAAAPPPAAASTYKPGALSSLFGFNAEALPEVESQPWCEALDTLPEKIEPKVEVVEDGEPKEKSISRSLQRENRKKKKDMTADNQRTIFVGNVAKEVHEKEIRKVFAEFGEIESIRARGIIPEKGNLTKKAAKLGNKISKEQTTLYFFVKYKQEESVAKALTLNGQERWGHRLRVDCSASKGKMDNSTTIFLGNLPYDSSEDSLSLWLEKLVGPVEGVRIVRDPATGKEKGFAFASFKESASVALALSMPKLVYKKRELRVSRVLKKNKLRKLPGQKSGPPSERRLMMNKKKAFLKKNSKSLMS
ncbi:unnamed protein product, partial [Mesorhabditis spiculigera]